MIKPRLLERGDRVALVAPASPFTRQDFDAGVEELGRLGFEPVFDDTVFDRRDYVSGDAATRAAAIRRAWVDPSIRALIAVRGGYGSAHVLPLLDPDEARRTAKICIGYSDVTSLLIFLNNCGLVCFHGPMLAGRLSRGPDGYDRDTFIRALTRPGPMGELNTRGLQTVRGGEATGLLAGGTLAQIVASLATPYAFDPPAEYILFIDEVGERPYRLDRMLTQLKYSGLVARASGVVFGELPRCVEPSSGLGARAVIEDVLSDFPGPVLFGFPSGHTIGPALTLPLGVMARIVGDDRPRLIIEEAAVEP
ncbi:MAG: LD-carboxypeptidase [Acidobacteria bacterium]|nr:LD-carboxypeptidase [Acidobacteriota bacterium]